MLVGNSQILVHNCSKVVTVKKVNGRTPINASYAGNKFTFNPGSNLAKKYPKGVAFTKDGFPDFSPYKKFEVDLGKLNKNSSTDIAQATKEYKRLTGKDVGPNEVWHHVENSNKLQLIPRDLHEAVKHTAGRATNAPR